MNKIYFLLPSKYCLKVGLFFFTKRFSFEIWVAITGLGLARLRRGVCPPRKPRCHLISSWWCPTSAHATHSSYIAHFPSSHPPLILLTFLRLFLKITSDRPCSLHFRGRGELDWAFVQQPLLVCRWLWLLSNLGRNRLAG